MNVLLKFTILTCWLEYSGRSSCTRSALMDMGRASVTLSPAKHSAKQIREDVIKSSK